MTRATQCRHMASSASCGILIVALALLGCNPKKHSDSNAEHAMSQDSIFGLEDNAELCGTRLIIGGFQGDDGQGGHLVVTTLRLAVCGKGDVGNIKPWKAVAVTVKSPTVQVRKSSAKDYSAASGKTATLEVSAKGDVLAKVADKSFKIGHANSIKSGYPIDLDSGVVAEVVVNGKPYELGDSKRYPSDQRSIWITAPDAE